MNHTVNGEMGYKLIFTRGMVVMLRPDGTPVYVSRWNPANAAQASRAAQFLGALSAMEGFGRSE